MYSFAYGVLCVLPLLASSQTVGITWNNVTVTNNSLGTLSAVAPGVSGASLTQPPLVCQGITGGQWYDPNRALYPTVNTTGSLYGQLNVSAGVQLYRGSAYDFPHGVQCCTNTTITLCIGLYADLTQAAAAGLPGPSYALSVAATYGPNITGGVQFQLLTPTNVDPPVFQLTCTSTSSPPTTVQWTFNGSPVNGSNYTSSQIVTGGPTSTYNNILTVTGRSPGMYTCSVTTTCSPVCGTNNAFTLNPRSTTSSLNVPAPPGPPTGVTAVQSGPTSVSVSWTAPTSGGPVSRYDIYYVANGVPSTSGGSTTSTSNVLTNLQVGVQYSISVIAVGTYIPSQGGAVLNITLPATTTTSPYSTSVPPPSSSSSPSSSLGAAIGGVIGALIVVALIIIIVVIVVLFMRHRGSSAHTKMDAAFDMEEKPSAVKPEAVTYETVADKKPTMSLHPSPLRPSAPSNAEGVTYDVVDKKKVPPTKPPPHAMGGPQTMPSAQTALTTQADAEQPYVNVAKTAPSIKEFPSDSDVLDGEEVVFNVRVTGYPRPSFTWYHNGSKVTTDHSLTLGEDGSLVILTAEMGHAGVYELEVANELGVDKRRVAIGVYGSEIELPGDYQMTVPAIPLAKFGPYVSKNHEKNNLGFNNQYRSLESSTKRPSTVAASGENKSLNRFANIVPYDENLIQLSPMEGQQDCQRSYINASYIAGYLEPKKFIATQGPLPKTIVDFWRCVWQEGVASIVMVTNIKEDGKTKCQQYWPESGDQKYGPFTVSITEQTAFADYVIRVFEVTLSDAPPRKVTQFHFTGWPDHGVPEYATSLLAFHRKVKTQHDGGKGPLLMHCSAGVGRTGTLIAIDTVLEQVGKEGIVDIAGTIRKMRRQRMKMVQTPDQYIFLHDAILESVMCGDTQVQVSNILTSLNALDKKDPKTGLTGMESQLQVLGQVSPDPKTVRRDVAMEEAGKNRNMDYLPPDRYRVILKQEYPDYINACFVNGYKQQKAFIIAQGPLKSTCRDFWKMVRDRNCGAIVMLSQLQEEGQEVCHQYWPDQGPEKYKEFTVEVTEVETHDGYIKRTMVMADKSAEAQEVTQFHITNWSPDGVCANLATITEVIEELDKVQRRTGNHPIVVHCSDTVGRSGMFCAITMVTQQCKAEGVLDVFQTVKAIRTQKPGAVLTVDQYKVIFKTVLVFVDSFNNYSNFKT